MPSRRSHLAVVSAAALGVLAVALPATAQTPAKITIVGGASMKPGVSVTDNQRFGPLSVSVASGGTLTVVNKAKTEDPHTLSVVAAKDLPKTAAGMSKCFEGGVCSKLEQAHTGGEEGEGPPKNPILNVGKAGLDQAGDSVFLAKKTERLKVSGASGKSMRFLCLIHPWMQGRIKVR